MTYRGRMVAALAVAALGGGAGCAPALHLPPEPLAVPGQLAPSDSAYALAERLAPMLYVQRDEPFSLLRVVAVVHPSRPIIAYHLLWSHDVNGQWMPWTKPSDEEEVWVGYDSATGAPIDEITKTARVQYDPVTLTLNSGVAQLKYKVQEAAQQACDSIDTFETDGGACVQNAIASAKPQIDAAVAKARSGASS